MGRIRTIKPEFFLDEDLARLEPLDRLAYAGLWCQADRSGRMEDKPGRLKVQILPWDDGDFDARLTRLTVAQFIQRYEVAGQKLIQIRTFEKHQAVHHTEAKSKLPPPVNGELTVRSPLLARELPVGKEGKGKRTEPNSVKPLSSDEAEPADPPGADIEPLTTYPLGYTPSPRSLREQADNATPVKCIDTRDASSWRGPSRQPIVYEELNLTERQLAAVERGRRKALAKPPEPATKPEDSNS